MNRKTGKKKEWFLPTLGMWGFFTTIAVSLNMFFGIEEVNLFSIGILWIFCAMYQQGRTP